MERKLTKEEIKLREDIKNFRKFCIYSTKVLSEELDKAEDPIKKARLETMATETLNCAIILKGILEGTGKDLEVTEELVREKLGNIEW